MISIEEELRQSRRAAENIADAGRRKKLAEQMARASGGISPDDILAFKWSPIRLLMAMQSIEPRKVKEGKLSPKEYSEKWNRSNYTGMINMDIIENSDIPDRDALGTNDYATSSKDDFVSAWFNDGTPLENHGVFRIDKSKAPLYRSHFSKKYPDIVTDSGFRGYQIRDEHLPFAETLDSLAVKNATKKSVAPNPKDGRHWTIGSTNTRYDANNYTKISVNYKGKKYSKNVDVFDVENLVEAKENDGFVKHMAKRATDFITNNSSRYFVTSPWYEDDE